ncbi:lyase family protein [Saccharopolyspora pogona]|uniref:lyase family protein n=1 Tax=Saccharopolyspora pogona TaxID=333966 RepID=UPI0016860EEB|nr:lyase family protein [Saccharopolyspora pogona]
MTHASETLDGAQLASTPTGAYHLDHDLLGDREIPAGTYWGVHNLRAVENFPITGQPLSTNPHLVRGLAAVKLAAARANQELELLDAERGAAIEKACLEILGGRLGVAAFWTTTSNTS